MEALVNRAEEVLNNLHKNDDTISKLLNDVKQLTEQSQKFSWVIFKKIIKMKKVKEKLANVDSESDRIFFDGM